MFIYLIIKLYMDGTGLVHCLPHTKDVIYLKPKVELVQEGNQTKLGLLAKDKYSGLNSYLQTPPVLSMEVLKMPPHQESFAKV